MLPKPTTMSNLRVYCHKIFMYLFILAIILACSNDIDILTNAVIKDTGTTIEERENSEEEGTDNEEEESTAEEPMEETDMEVGFESRSTEFPPIEDAYVQGGMGFDQTIIRLDEDSRTSYLKFDLSPIEAIGGYITDATLQFTIDSDEGNGTVNIHKGLNSDWTEQEIDNSNVPDIDILLGSVTKEYKIGNTEEVSLSATNLLPENTSLVLQHFEGNDLAFASKEHPSKIGPKLVIRYNAPETADMIVIDEEEPAPPAEENTPEENTPAENTAPLAIADASPSSGGVPLQVNFTGSNSSDDKAIITYEWDFKDGNTANTANPSHTYDEIGSFEAVLLVTDAEGLSTTDTVTINVNEEANEGPVAIINADKISGEFPLEVKFNGNSSTDDNGIVSYAWNFKDGGSSANANPTYTFNTAGNFDVELTVTDENELTDIASLTITVTQPQSPNEAPVAVASANPTSGDAPLHVNFQGTASTDEKAITSYLWDFGNNDTSSAPNPSRTYPSPGVYNAQLTVTDAEGLTSTDNVSITVNEAPGGGGGSNIPCSTGGGRADESGNKVWCWNDIEITEAQNKDSNPFSNGELRTSNHCNIGMVTRSGDRLYFKVNPTSPAPENWCNSNYNYRSEIRENPSDVDHPPGTETWFGWNYRFENNYQVDGVQWLFWQLHDNDQAGNPPPVSLWIAAASMSGQPFTPGEIVVVNAAQNPNNHKYTGTGIVPGAGDSYNIVVHLVHGTESTGSYTVWINGNQVYNSQERTLYSSYPLGGYAKWGIYKWKWRDKNFVDTSAAAGMDELNTSMGTLRIVTRRPGDANYGQNSYALVAPD